MSKEPAEIVIREYVGGVADGEIELVGPDDDKDDIHTRSRHWPESGRSGLQAANAEDVYEFSHEETSVVTVRKWVYARQTSNGETSID